MQSAGLRWHKRKHLKVGEKKKKGFVQRLRYFTLNWLAAGRPCNPPLKSRLTSIVVKLKLRATGGLLRAQMWKLQTRTHTHTWKAFHINLQAISLNVTRVTAALTFLFFSPHTAVVSIVCRRSFTLQLFLTGKGWIEVYCWLRTAKLQLHTDFHAQALQCVYVHRSLHCFQQRTWMKERERKKKRRV